MFRALRGLLADGTIQKWRIDGRETGYGFHEYSAVTPPKADDVQLDRDRVYRWNSSTRSYEVSYEDVESAVLGPHDFSIGAIRYVQFACLG